MLLVEKKLVAVDKFVKPIIYYYYVFILSAISPYTTGLKALFNQCDYTGTVPTHK